MKNHEQLGQGANHDEQNFETTSTSAVINAIAGDSVWVRLDKGVASGLSPNHHTHFTGYRIGLNAKESKLTERRAQVQSVV